MLITGDSGEPGNATITISEEGSEVHPAELVTVKVCVPIVKPVMVVLTPVPLIDPGLIVQLPEGKPFNITLPVATPQVV
jgi:hypothetical protein